MSRFKDIIIDIQEDLERGKLSFQQIADFYGMPVGDVEAVSYTHLTLPTNREV